MSTNKTEHYGLHLWEPEDSFVRAEFNENSEKVDAALWVAARRVDAVDYSLFNLLLRDYYEGKYTGWKKALVFDGFLDESRIAQRSEGLLWDQGRLTLSHPNGQAEEVASAAGWVMTSGVHPTISDPVTVAETCYFWRLKASWRVGSSNVECKTINVFYFYVNGADHHSEEHLLDYTRVGKTEYIELQQPIRLAAGDTVQYTCAHSGTVYQISVTPGNNPRFYGVFGFRSATALAGSMVSTAAALPAGGGALAWVRHDGGNVSAALHWGETVLPLPEVGQQTAQTAQGTACTETVFALHRPLEAGDWAVALDAALGEDDDMTLWDYGVVVV